MEANEKRGSTGLALKAGFWYVVSNFMVKALSFITTPIFSRLMSTEHYGEFSNYASWQTTLLIITGAELHSTLSRAYYDYPEDYDKYISSVTISGCLLTLGFYLLFQMCSPWIYSIVAIPPDFVHMMFFTMTFQSCKAIWLARERTLYRYKSVAAVSMLNLVVPTAVALIMVVVLPEEQRLGARIYGTYIPMSVIGIVCAASMVMKGRSFQPRHVGYALRLSLPLLVHYLTVTLLTSSNTMVTKSMMGAEAAAVVSMTTSTIHILTILFQALSGAVTTWLMDNLNQNNTAVVRKGVVLYSAGIVVVASGTILLAPEIVWILGGSKYMAAVELIPGLILGIVFQSVASVFNIILTYDKKVVKTAVYTGIVAVVSIAVKIVLLPTWGYDVLVWTNVCAFVLLFVINYLLVKQAGYGQYINLAAICAVILVCVAATLLSLFMYRNTVLRYGLIAVIFVACAAVPIRYRHKILPILKKKFKKQAKSELGSAKRQSTEDYEK